MKAHEIRQKFLDFFKTKQHAIIKSASLIPENDPTVLFTTAGMHPLVPYLMGEKHPEGVRLANVQKCIRTQDIDEVGDATHLTFFEMLGNWSLGEYFKREAIEWSYEFLTDTKWLGIPPEKIYATVFEGDDNAPLDTESIETWQKVMATQGIQAEVYDDSKNDDSNARIFTLPKSENWWGPAGETGPCGPDTEMFYYIGEGTPNLNEERPGFNDSNFVEIWNDVFMQYNKNKDGSFNLLKQQNVDTGMGLERVAAILQNKKNVYETELFQPIMEKIRELAFGENGEKVSMTFDENSNMQTPPISPRHGGGTNIELHSIRIVADHIKAATFMIADGARPSNTDQGYVLRRIIRRAIRHAKKLEIKTEFTALLSDIVIEIFGEAYPELIKHSAEIEAALNKEEQQFAQTLVKGTKIFEKVASETKETIKGEDIFHLYDTYGFPPELTTELADEKNLKVDLDGFEKCFKEHQNKSRQGAEQKFKGGLQDHSEKTTAYHTATHLLQAALRQILGEHVVQKGSNITAERLRFDFPHPEKMTQEQKQAVEDLVNEKIQAALPVEVKEMTVDEAKKTGALGLFEDRYDARVKVYTIGDSDTPFSCEICGGPHVKNTSELGVFKIKKEQSSSAGIRRIKAILK